MKFLIFHIADDSLVSKIETGGVFANCPEIPRNSVREIIPEKLVVIIFSAFHCGKTQIRSEVEVQVFFQITQSVDRKMMPNRDFAKCNSGISPNSGYPDFGLKLMLGQKIQPAVTQIASKCLQTLLKV
ncbi:hypothetical protein SDC9_176483 [bioreactor metagenome]|uniref:Uncharacterized protein n=1 Tax=bioreactor metagenome TaxID=1076179 RepID=A0A645GQS6_9ZZZZ